MPPLRRTPAATVQTCRHADMRKEENIWAPAHCIMSSGMPAQGQGRLDGLDDGRAREDLLDERMYASRVSALVHLSQIPIDDLLSAFSSPPPSRPLPPTLSALRRRRPGWAHWPLGWVAWQLAGGRAGSLAQLAHGSLAVCMCGPGWAGWAGLGTGLDLAISLTRSLTRSLARSHHPPSA